VSGRQQLERIMEIDRQVRAGFCPNARSLAVLLEVHERTLYQDRQFMVDRLKAPLAFDRKRGGWCYTDTAWTLPNVMITEGELLAFFLCVEAARRCLGTPFETTLRSAVTKITSGLRAQVDINLEELRQQYMFASLPVMAANEEFLLDLHRAIQGESQVRIHYYTASRGCWQERVVDPYHLYNRSGEWYMIAFDHLRSAVRIFHAGRVDRWEVLTSRFTRDPGFRLEEWMGQAFQLERGEKLVDVAIRFDSYQARYIRERRWHPTQEIEELPDGGLILRFRAGGLNAVRRWVMSYGSSAEVLAPESLRAEIAAECRGLTRLYELR
jgi:predicted DNA-binding transcriptional regulator YafY